MNGAGPASASPSRRPPRRWPSCPRVRPRRRARAGDLGDLRPSANASISPRWWRAGGGGVAQIATGPPSARPADRRTVPITGAPAPARPGARPGRGREAVLQATISASGRCPAAARAQASACSARSAGVRGPRASVGRSRHQIHVRPQAPQHGGGGEQADPGVDESIFTGVDTSRWDAGGLRHTRARERTGVGVDGVSAGLAVVTFCQGGFWRTDLRLPPRPEAARGPTWRSSSRPGTRPRCCR